MKKPVSKQCRSEQKMVSEHSNKRGSVNRRGFLQTGALAAIGAGLVACTGSLDHLKQRIEITADDADFNSTISSHGGNNITFVIKAKVTLTADLVIGSNVQIIVEKGEKTGATYTTGEIDIQDHKLTLYCPFEAGPFKVFTYQNPLHIFGENGVNFKRGSVRQVEAMWFGADPSAVTDSTYPIQRAIDAAVEVRKVVLPGGYFKISDTIHLAVYDSTNARLSGLSSFILEGQGGRMQGYTGLFFDATTNPKKDRPLLNIQFGHHVALRNLNLSGLNEKPTAEGNTLKRPDRDHWITTGCTSGQYNPYCGVAVDGYNLPSSMTAGTSHYPQNTTRNVEYSYINGSGSQDIILENVTISKFVVGLMVAPGPTGQTDSIVVKKCIIDGNTYGVALGSTQANVVHVKDCSFARFHTALVTDMFGSQAAPNINCTNNQYAAGRSIYRFSAAKSHPCNISGDFCENVMRLGTFGTIAGASPHGGVSFNGCNYDLRSKNSVNQDQLGSAGVVVTRGLHLHFQACGFNFGGKSDMLLHNNNGSFAFESCSFHFNDATTTDCIQPRIWLAAGTNVPISYNIGRSNTSFKKCTMWGSGCQVDLDEQLYVRLQTKDPVRQPIHWSTHSIRASGGNYGEQILPLHITTQGTYTTNGNLHPCVLPALLCAQTPTLDPGNSNRVLLKPYSGWASNFIEGDRIFYIADYHQDDVGPTVGYRNLAPSPLLEMTSVDGNNLDTNGFAYAEVPVTDSFYRQDFTFHSSNNDWPVYVFPRTDFGNPNNSQMYVILNGSVKGDVTSGSPTVNNVTNPTLLQVGDFINENIAPPWTRIKAISGSTVTLTHNATTTSTAAHLPAIYVSGT